MVPLARRYLFAEKVRLLMSVFGVAFAVLLTLVIASLYRGWAGMSTFFTELPGQLWVVQEGADNPFRSSSLLPEASLEAIASIDGVEVVLPSISRTLTVDVGDTTAQVFFLAVASPDPGHAGETGATLVPRSGAIIIDEVLADDSGLGEGDSVEVLGSDLTVERVRGGGNPLIGVAFMNAADASELLGVEGYVSYFLLDIGTGVDVAAISAAVGEAIPGSEVRTSEELAAVIGDEVDRGFLPVVGALVAIGLFVGGAIVALMTYTSTVEKLSDFAVLKALGASPGFVYRVVVRQSVAVGVLGSIVGVAWAIMVPTLVRRLVPEFVTELRLLDVAGVVAVTLGVSLLAALVPARRVNLVDPAAVFRA